MSNVSSIRARSDYGQIRLTVTFEPSGTVSYRALAKRPDDQWTEMAVFAAGKDDWPTYPPTFHDALSRLAVIAEGLRWLPGERR